MATIKQIANLCDVSMTTVSRVLNQDKTIAVSTEVKNKIFDVAHELGYVPPKKRRLKAEQGLTIGIADWHIIRDGMTNMKFSEYAGIANRFCREPIEFKRMHYGEDIKVDGIIALGSFSEEEVIFLKAQSYSILFINSDRQDYQYDRIIMDYNEGLMQMVNYILETRQYESLGYIGGYFEAGPNVVIGKTRHKTLVRILKEKKRYDKELFHIGEVSKSSGYKLAKKAIQEKRLARAVLLGNDQVAEGVLEALYEEQIKVPEEVDIIIYKDIETIKSKFPEYTSVQMFTNFMWETAIKLMIERVTGVRREAMTVILPSKFCAK